MKLTANAHLYADDKIAVHHGQGFTALKLADHAVLFLSEGDVKDQLRLIDNLQSALLELEGKIRVSGKA